MKAAAIVTHWLVIKCSLSEAGGNWLLGSLGWGRRGAMLKPLLSEGTLCVTAGQQIVCPV